MRLIDADKLIEEWTIASPEPYTTDAAEVLDSIRNAPTINLHELCDARQEAPQPFSTRMKNILECPHWQGTFCEGEISEHELLNTIATVNPYSQQKLRINCDWSWTGAPKEVRCVPFGGNSNLYDVNITNEVLNG